MTTDAVPAAIVPLRPAWRSLLWTVPFTVLWTWLIYSLPVLLASGLPALAVRLSVHGLIALGLWLDLARNHGPAHALVRRRLDRGHQRCLPHQRLRPTVAASGDLPACHHRRSAV